MNINDCISCGKCCEKHWLVKLTSDKEKKLFKKELVFGEFIWTDECKYFMKSKCKIHNERQPFKCKEYFCEGKKI